MADRVTAPHINYSGFEYSDGFEGLSVTPGKATRTYRTLKIEFRSDYTTHPENDVVRGECYLPTRRSGKSPGILVFPILSGGEPLSRSLGRSLARAGNVALVLDQKEELFKSDSADLMFTDSVLRQAAADARQALNWLEQREEVDPERLGCVGISMGGILACMVAGLDSRIKASAWLLAGGDLLEILAVTREPSLRKARESWLKDQTSSLAEIVERHRGRLADPLNYAVHVDPTRSMMVTARFDRVIPRANADQLWEATGRPARRIVPFGHFTALLTFPFSKRWVVKFFDEQFER